MSPVPKSKKYSRNKTTRSVDADIVRLARFGYAAKGIVYIVLGYMALQATFGAGNPKIDQNAALVKIITQPYGRYLLAIITLGLVAYVIWRLVEVIFNPEHEKLLARLGYLSSGAGYAFLALAALQLLRGVGGTGSSSQAPQDFTARALALPWGQILVIAVGIIIIASGLYQIYYGYKEKFVKNLRLTEMRAEQRRWTIDLGKFGTIARAIIYIIIGIFLIQAALTRNPARAGGLGEALVALARSPYGIWVLGFVALGLLAYGIFSEVMARYYRVNYQGARS